MAIVRLADAGAAPASSRALPPAADACSAPDDAEAPLGEHGRDPVRPHPVLGNVAEVDVARRRLPPTDERVRYCSRVSSPSAGSADLARR